MSVSGYRGFSASIFAASQLRETFNEQTRQAGSGQRAGSYAGLGSDAKSAMTLRAAMAQREVLGRNAESAAARADYTQTVLTRLNDIAGDAAASAGSLAGKSRDELSVIAQTARQQLQEVVSLLGDSYQGEAVFGGSDLGRSPIVAPKDFEWTGFYQQIRSQLGSLGTESGANVLAASIATASSDAAGTTPFSDYASDAAQGTVEDPRRSVMVDDGVSVEIGLYANRNAAAAPSGVTGSWARDLLHGLTMLANMDAVQDPTGSDFTTIAQGTVASLRGAVDGVAAEAGALGLTQARLEKLVTHQSDVGDQLELQLGALEQVDPAEAIVRLQDTQTRLQASYKSLAMLGEVSLVNYL
jgi:flagellar hook-associated protein 3 FlgL